MTISPVARRRIAADAPTIAGTPSSRATMAAWQVRPPRSVTIAAAVFITGCQSGVVVSATRISPGRNAASSPGAFTTRTGPDAIASPIARPRAKTSPRVFNAYVFSDVSERREATVSGRAWTM